MNLQESCLWRTIFCRQVNNRSDHTSLKKMKIVCSAEPIIIQDNLIYNGKFIPAGLTEFF